ncbi:MAG: FecR family protein, partial [bacterium]
TFLTLCLFLFVSQASAEVSANGTFISVKGTVTIKSQVGHHNRLAKVGSTVHQGQRVVTNKTSSAVLQFFDGSQLTIRPGTDFWLSKLLKPAKHEKILQFKLLAGYLFAKVTKLASANSSFEINAGGVVCGVRGTEFSMHYDPTDNKLILTVVEGTVYSDIDGKIVPYGIGSRVEFLDGKFQGVTNDHPAPQAASQPSGNDITASDQTLAQLQQVFGDFISVNGDNVFVDPGVAGSSQLIIHADVPGQEVRSILPVVLNVSGQEAQP